MTKKVHGQARQLYHDCSLDSNMCRMHPNSGYVKLGRISPRTHEIQCNASIPQGCLKSWHQCMISLSFKASRVFQQKLMALERATPIVTMFTALAWVSFQLKPSQGMRSHESGTSTLGMERGQEKRKTKRKSSPSIQQYLSNSCSEPGITLHAQTTVEPAPNETTVQWGRRTLTQCPTDKMCP